MALSDILRRGLMLCRCDPIVLSDNLEVREEDMIFNSATVQYPWIDILRATCSLDERRVLGRGRESTVYRGHLEEGLEVAVKVLEASLTTTSVREIEVLTRCHHPNVVMLLGWSEEKHLADVPGYRGVKSDSISRLSTRETLPSLDISQVDSSCLQSGCTRPRRALVYEYLPGGNASQRLYSSQESFPWRARLRTAIQACRGLVHVHRMRPEVFHRDIKTSNILFDEAGNAKIADFGLACASGHALERYSTSQTLAGTPGYAEPTYGRSGLVTESSEVYSFGMVLIELLTARPPASPNPQGGFNFLLQIVRPELPGAQERLMQLVDERADWPLPTAAGLANFSLLCIHGDEQRRPTFLEATGVLRSLYEATDGSEDLPEDGQTWNRQGANSRDIPATKAPIKEIPQGDEPIRSPSAEELVDNGWRGWNPLATLARGNQGLSWMNGDISSSKREVQSAEAADAEAKAEKSTSDIEPRKSWQWRPFGGGLSGDVQVPAGDLSSSKRELQAAEAVDTNSPKAERLTSDNEASQQRKTLTIAAQMFGFHADGDQDPAGTMTEKFGRLFFRKSDEAPGVQADENPSRSEETQEPLPRVDQAVLEDALLRHDGGAVAASSHSCASPSATKATERERSMVEQAPAAGNSPRRGDAKAPQTSIQELEARPHLRHICELTPDM
eukprot:TRINITY_DN20862_c0_g1_i6.p1 TRINITY_DN20862_c0_g1~~TRINITY_DN20862_c0_g1_i6.p1  ORF type:complete len:674 (+),score=118.66 TRINITY_DN20862_c0_g1_i6:206-2227(+)